MQPNWCRPDPAKAGAAGKLAERKTSIGSWVALGVLVAAFVVAALDAWLGAADRSPKRSTGTKKTGLARCEELWGQNQVRALENNPSMTGQRDIDDCMADDSLIRRNEGR